MRALRIVAIVIVLLAAFIIVSAENNIGLITDPAATSAVISRTISYQGILKDGSGNPVLDDTYDFTFRIYKQPSGGSAIWTSSLTPVATSDGVFSTEISPINLPFDTTYFLSIQVSPDPEMTQRQKMTMMPYAAVADTANYAFSGPDLYWNLSNNVLYTNNKWAIAKGNAGNILYGDSIATMVNFGVACTTGYSSGGDEVGCTIGGGQGNRVLREFGTVSGGQGNRTYEFGTVSGGQENSALDYSFVGGGYGNKAEGITSAIVGGMQDTTSGWLDAVVSGIGNAARGSYSVICNGQQVRTSGQFSFVGSGAGNHASGRYSFIGNGTGNTVAGDHSSILNGDEVTLDTSADYSLAFGEHIYLNSPNRVAFFSFQQGGFLGVNRDDTFGGINYPIHVGNWTGDGNGAYLSPGGVWTNGSSRTFKENGRPVAGPDLLEKITNLQLDHYNFANSDETHIGPYAEDFVAAFDVGIVREIDGQREDQYLAAGDVAGVALAGVKELIELVSKLREENKELKSRLEELESKTK